MNTGAEAVETGIKISRKWAYQKKGVPLNEAIVFSCKNNFHGRTMTAISMSTDNTARNEFGPYLPNVGPQCPKTGDIIRYNNYEDLEKAFEKHGKKAAAFLVEPIQGEAGIIVPDKGYLKKCYDLCKKHNVLFIADEIQSGLGRSGKLLAIDYDNVKPDMILLGKALSGGVYPVSAVLANDDIMSVIKPGEHGSTYGGNPLASAVGIESLKVLKEEGMIENSYEMGNLFREGLKNLKSPLIKESINVFNYFIVRGKGLLNAIEIDQNKIGKYSAWDLCVLMKEKGLLAKPTHNTIIRMTPPLIINENQIKEGIEIISESLKQLDS